MDAYPEINGDKLENQLDKRYQCFEDIGLVYHNSESVVEGITPALEGVAVLKDREYCEILHLGNEAKKYDCIQKIAIVK
jgi:hypothetical protein